VPLSVCGIGLRRDYGFIILNRDIYIILALIGLVVFAILFSIVILLG
jgi:hypothetical protein